MSADKAIHIDLERTQIDTNLAICQWFSDARVRVFGA